jgi:hypothetical protein
MKNLLSLTLFVVLAGPAFGVDGVVLINQSIALAGGVTPGDTTGFPVTISVSGSYQLSGNLVVPDANTTAIQITANNVTIDLNGFSIIGPVVCSGFPTSCVPAGTGTGIDGGSFNGVTVLHGVVTGMGGGGIGLFGIGARVEEIRALGNGGIGIAVGSATVSFSEASNNGFIGFDGEGMFISDTATFNGSHGMQLEFAAGSVVMNNRVSSNNGTGILASVPATISGNSAYFNQVGISGCGSITSNSAAFNSSADIVAGAGCTRANNYPAP